MPPGSSIITPTNALLLAIAVVLVYWQLAAGAGAGARGGAAAGRPRRPVVYGSFTPATLRPHDGRDGRAVYLAVRGRVYDVSAGRRFYGPGGPYASFAGRDASRGLACQRFDDAVLTDALTGLLDPLDDLDAEQADSLAGWEEHFRGKYLEVGRLLAEQPAAAATDGPDKPA